MAMLTRPPWVARILSLVTSPGALARSYFFECSDGGREGMVEATRYPADFDGYIVGDPFSDVPGQILAGRAAKALLDVPDAYIPPTLLALDDAVYASCDASDGFNDNLIQNLGTCSFDPEILRCKGSNTVNCLAQNQVNILNAWFSAVKDEQGRVVSLDFPASDVCSDGAPGNNLHR